VNTNRPCWPFALPPKSLAGDEVHVWCASLDRPPEHVARLSEVLSDNERERVSRFRSAFSRNEYLVSRGLLRTLLGHYLCRKPERLIFSLGPQGKPVLPGEPELHFNVAHSGGFALFAVRGRGEVGVDLERVRPFENDMGLAERYFSPREVEVLRTLGPERRIEAFFHTWARKEAVLKANGHGLALGLEGVEVNVLSDEPARLLRVNGEESCARCWTLWSLLPVPGYVGAVALEGRDVPLTCWHWPD
jgi:4'-phosphopantetheinyl transferase